MSSTLARNTAAAAAAVAGLAALPGVAAGDAVYHTQHMALTPVGDAPLRSGYVQNIKANGPTIYAHEIYVLNGARARTTYTVTRDFFFQDPACTGELVFHEDVATLRTNASGNAQGDAFVEPADVVGFEGVHGVTWTVRDATGTVAYRTTCTAVTLD